jgi:hypothetical protein
MSSNFMLLREILVSQDNIKIKVIFFWDVTPWSLIESYLRVDRGRMFYQAARVHIPDGSNFHILWRKKIKSRDITGSFSTGPHRKHRTSIVAFVSVATGMCSLSSCPETCCVTLLIKNPLPQQWASFRDRYPATAVHATVLWLKMNNELGIMWKEVVVS